MTADPSEKSAVLPPIDVTLEPGDSQQFREWVRSTEDNPEFISPVPVKTREELLAEIEAMRQANLAISESLQAEIVRRGRKLDTLILAAESIDRHCAICGADGSKLEPLWSYVVTLSGAQILALRSAIAAAK